MATLNPPIYLQAGTYPARYDRLAQATLLTPAPAVGPLAARAGVRPGGLIVTQRLTPAMFVSIAAGSAVVQSASATGGAYVAHNDASVDVAIAAAHATLARKDLIVARIYDAEVSGSANEWKLESITGTPAGSPAVPATPNGALALAQVSVAAAATTVVNANITDMRVYTSSLGGMPPALSTAMPASPYKGQGAYQTDLSRPVWHDGSSWKGWSDEGYQTAANVTATLTGGGYLTQTALDATGWTTYVPTWGAASSNPTLGNGTKLGRYIRIGKLVFVQVWFGFGSTTTFGSGIWSWTLPITAKDGWAPGSGNPFGVGGGTCMLNKSSPANVAGGFAFLWDVGSPEWRIRCCSDAGVSLAQGVPWTWGANDDFQVNLWYEID